MDRRERDRIRPFGRVWARLLAVLSVVAAAAFLASAETVIAAPGKGGGGDSRATELERRLGPGVTASLHRETGRVRFVSTRPGRPIQRPEGLPASVDAEAVGRAFFERFGPPFGVRDQVRELALDRVTDAPRGRSSVRFQQQLDGVPVIGGELIVNLDRNGNVLSASGEALPAGPAETKPGIERADARDAALDAVAKTYGVPAGSLRPSPSELWIYDSRLLGGPGLERPLLTWRFEVSAPGLPIRELVLVDAQLGTVALSFNQIANALDREVCDAGNADAGYPCTVGESDRSEGDPATGNRDVDDAYDFAGDTYDFFSNRFGRDSLDGAGMKLFSTVRYCPSGEPCPYENAFWDGEQMVYGEGYIVDDVVGHELAHGVTDFSARLFYYYQSGAINESLSDVFGELVDLTNGAGTDTAETRWLLGEDLPGGAIRDMADPGAFGDPDQMTSPNYWGAESDNGGVHINSGVNNKAAYLLTDGTAGGTFNGKTVTGLGITKAARIYYEAETNMLTSASDYADLYDGLQQACTNLIGTDGISAADCVEVTDTVDATEMNVEPPAAPTPQAPTCGSGETVVSSFFDDLENTSSGNWDLSSNVGANEWYYPPDLNPHDFDATFATSGTRNLWGYNRPERGDFSIEMTSDLTVPVGGSIRFNHAHGFENSLSPVRNWDGGVVEYSTDGGSSWTDAGALFTHNGYTGTIYAQGRADNPLKGRSAFVGESKGYISSRLDLSSLAGESIRFRFRIGTDSIIDDYGWFVDDVRIYRCEAAPDNPPIADAGDDQAVASEQAGVTLDGSGSSDPDGDPLTYSWTQTAGTPVTLDDPSSATPSFDAPVGPDTLTFELTVNDGEAADADTVVVSVNGPVVGVIDAAAELILNGPTGSSSTTKNFTVRVSNLGTGPITIDPISEIDAEVSANGSPKGLVTLQSTGAKTLSPGARTRFRFQWDYTDIAAGDSISYEGCVNVANDAVGGSDCDAATVTAR